MNERLKQISEQIKQINIQLTKKQSESGCIPCDLAVASSLIAYCYNDKTQGEKMREKYLKGEITLGKLIEPILQNKDKNSKTIAEFTQKRFRHAMGLKFTDFEE